MTTQPQSQVQVPQSWEGSVPEYIAYSTFVGFGLEPGQDLITNHPSWVAGWIRVD